LPKMPPPKGAAVYQIGSFNKLPGGIMCLW